MCELCDRDQEHEQEAAEVEARTPRINLEALDRGWARVEAAVVAEAASRGLMMTARQVEGLSQLDGWDQNHWRAVQPRCGTTLCLAGFVVEADVEEQGGGGWLVSNEALVNAPSGDELWDCLVARDDDPEGDLREQRYGDVITRVVRAEARTIRVTGLNEYEADMVFGGNLTFKDVRAELGRLRLEELMRRERARLYAVAQAETEDQVPEVTEGDDEVSPS